MSIRRAITMAAAAAFLSATAWGVGAGGGTGGGTGGGAGGGMGGGGSMGGGISTPGTPGGAGETMQKGMEGAGQGVMKGMEGAGQGAKGAMEGAGKGAAAVGEGAKSAGEGVKSGFSRLFGKEVGTYRGETGKQRFEKFSKTIRLNPGQREKLEPIFNDEAKELKGLYAKGLERGEREGKEREILTRYYGKIKDVLDPDQLKIYRKLRGE
jgi:hypothetical protein